MSYIWRSHGTQENEWYDAKVWFMPTEHLQVCWGDVTTMRYWWLLLLCSLQCRCWLTSPPYVTHDLFARVPWLTRTCVMTHSMCVRLILCVPWPIHMGFITHSFQCFALPQWWHSHAHARMNDCNLSIHKIYVHIIPFFIYMHACIHVCICT